MVRRRLARGLRWCARKLDPATVEITAELAGTASYLAVLDGAGNVLGQASVKLHTSEPADFTIPSSSLPVSIGEFVERETSRGYARAEPVVPDLWGRR